MSSGGALGMLKKISEGVEFPGKEDLVKALEKGSPEKGS
jgi:hypothetical protein